MSAAVNDRPHTVIVPLPHLPLTGDLHPLRREFARWLATGNMITIMLAVTVCAIAYFWPRAEVSTGVPIDGLVKGGIFPQPPPIIIGGGAGGNNFVTTPDVPVNYLPTDEVDLVPRNDITDVDGGTSDVPGPADSWNGDESGGFTVVDPPAPAPRSDGFIIDNIEPVLLSIVSPVYPEMVRDAGIDGTVLVRVFIAIDGHVKDAYVVEGSPALREAALASARTAFFKPALQGTHPVDVWVVIPITFELNERY